MSWVFLDRPRSATKAAMRLGVMVMVVARGGFMRMLYSYLTSKASSLIVNRMSKLRLFRLVRTWSPAEVDEGDVLPPIAAARELGVTIAMVVRLMEDGSLPAYSVEDEDKVAASRRIQRYTSRKAVAALKKVRAGKLDNRAGAGVDKTYFGVLPARLAGSPA